MKQKNSDTTAGQAPRRSRTACWLIPLVALLDTLVIELLNHKAFTVGLAGFTRFVTRYPLALLVNALLVLVTLAPAFFLRRRVFWCTLVSSLWLICGGVNGFILLNRMTPFTTADLTVLNTGLDTLPNYMSTGYLILLAAAILALLVLLVFLLIRGPKQEGSLRRRLISGAVAVVLSGAALAGCWTLAFRVGQLSSVFSNLAFAYEDYGFSYCFLQTWLNKGIRQPVGYGASAITQIRETVEKNTPETDPQTDVNVIYVQLESFIDPAQIQTLTLSEDAVPNWTALTAGYTSGYLNVPVVGAGTANTECEVLTGMSTRFFGPGEYPYKTCLLDHTVESVAYDLAANGYATHAIHNHRATFYSRNQVYANLGFEDFTSLEYMPYVRRTPRGWALDSVLTREIRQALDATADQADLVFTVSVQGHGSYPTEPLLEDPAVTVTACSNREQQYAIEYYVNQIREMDTFIGNLIQDLSQRKEKTILVLYGDHLPSLNFTREDMASGSLFQTQYVIWDNFGLPQEDEDLYAYQLSASVLGKLGVTTGTINALHQFCREDSTYRLDLKKLQYDVLYGRNYLNGGTSPYAPVDMKMGAAPITVTKLTVKQDCWYLEGENFSPYCKATVDGDVLDTDYISTRLLRINEDPGTDRLDDIVISVVDSHKEILSDTE